MQGCHGARTPAQCRKRGAQCQYDESLARCVWNKTDFIDTLSSVCGTDTDQSKVERVEILKAIEEDLALYGIAYPDEQESSLSSRCERVPILMLAHVLLRPFGDHVAHIESALKAIGTRASSLPEFLQDIESFVDRLQSSVPKSHRWEAYAQALPGLQESIVRYGPSRTGRILAAGGIMLLVLLAMGLGSAYAHQEVPPPDILPEVHVAPVEMMTDDGENWLQWGAMAIGQGALTAAGGQLFLRALGKRVLPAQPERDTATSLRRRL